MGRTPEALVLQIFPRYDPSRAVTYAGDQAYIRRVLRDLERRLEEPVGDDDSSPLQLLDEGEYSSDHDGGSP